MRFVRIAVQAFYIREDGIGEMVVFVNKEVNTLVGLIAFREQVFKLFDSSFFFVEFFLHAFGEIVGVNITEVVEHRLAMRVQSLAVVVQFAYYSLNINKGTAFCYFSKQTFHNFSPSLFSIYLAIYLLRKCLSFLW